MKNDKDELWRRQASEKLEGTFVALLDNADERQKKWVKLRKQLYQLKNEFKKLLPTQLHKLMTLPYTGLAEIYDTYVALRLDEKIVYIWH